MRAPYIIHTPSPTGRPFSWLFSGVGGALNKKTNFPSLPLCPVVKEMEIQLNTAAENPLLHSDQYLLISHQQEGGHACMHEGAHALSPSLSLTHVHTHTGRALNRHSLNPREQTQVVSCRLVRERERERNERGEWWE